MIVKTEPVWTIKNTNGWLWSETSPYRVGVIRNAIETLEGGEHLQKFGPLNQQEALAWRRVKRKWGVRAVKVFLTEVPND